MCSISSMYLCSRSRSADVMTSALFGHELVYFRSEHIENAEATRALAAWLLVHDINSELHLLTVDVQGYDRSAFWDATKIVREYSP